MEYVSCFLAIFITISMVILIETWRINSIKNLPPGPFKLPIIGNLHQLVGSLPHRRLADLAKKHGPLMHLQLGQLSQIVVSSPEVAKEVLKTHDISFASRPFNLAIDVIFYNARDLAFAPYGEYWRQVRKICMVELFSAKRVQSFRLIWEEEVSDMTRSIASSAGEPVNLNKILTNLLDRIITKTAFGKQRQKREAFDPIVQEIAHVLGGFSMADLFPSYKIIGVVSGMRSKLQKLHQKADEIIEDIIREHRERRKSKNEEVEDLVDVLLNLQDSEILGVRLTIENIKAILLDVFMAGIDTSSVTLEWAMSELIRHPKALERAQVEVRRVFDGTEIVTESTLHGLTYLNLVIKEVLRLHPPAPLLLPRETRETVEICGYKIPKKTQVIINAQMITTDPNYWIESEKFNPERFLNSSVDYKGTHFEMIPFGAGRRMCPGMIFGLSVVELALANLLYHFDWEIPNRGKVEDVDMSESFGNVVRRKKDLVLVPKSYNPDKVKET